MTALLWGIKASLLDYVRRMPDGAITTSDGASQTDGGFLFPSRDDASADLAFCGAVTLRGHSGMMRVVITNPSLVQVGDAWWLEIDDPDDPDIRLLFAAIGQFDGERGTGTALTEDGADLFFGPYAAGTPVDDPRVLGPLISP